MFGGNRQTMYAVIAEARLQALDQCGNRLICHRICHRTCHPILPAACPGKQAARADSQRLGRLGTQRQHFNRSRQLKALQALDEHTTDTLGVARGAGQTKRQESCRTLPGATLVLEHENTFADTTATRRKPAAEHADQPPPGKTQRQCVFDTRRQFQSLGKALGENEAGARVRQLAKRTRQIGDKSDTQTARQAGTRQTQHIAY